MEKKTVVVSAVVDDLAEEVLSIGEHVLKGMSGEVRVKPAFIHATSISQFKLRIYRRKKGKKLDSKRILVFIEKPKYSKRSRLSNFWPKMPRSLDLGDLLRYHLGRTNHE